MTFAGFPGERADEIPARLLTAGIDTLIELGLPRCTPAEVARRAGTAPAALFRYFGTLQGFLVAVAEEVACRQLVAFQSRLDAAPRDADPFETTLRLLRDLTEEPINVVFNELLVASRTDHVLAGALMPQLEAYGRDIEAIAAQLPGLDAIPPALFHDLVRIAIDIFRGTSVRGNDRADRIPLMLSLIRGDLAFLFS
ncbi:TetR/AcrR family transcriptional regulator [Actinocorallia longicatena]|uniref:HTH tetR-type domain-containing protein n=1 Tax=Actinocorallia longicatena TaxID=111803 RepID=A0ABP6PYC0_9ACTN